MNNLEISIWGRMFDLNVIFETYDGSVPQDTQIDSAKEINSSIFDAAKPEVERYVLENNNGDLKVEVIDNIFKYVVPKMIYVPQKEDHHCFALLCHYKFDEEHGMALVFCDGKLDEIGPEDLVL